MASPRWEQSYYYLMASSSFVALLVGVAAAAVLYAAAYGRAPSAGQCAVAKFAAHTED